MDLTEDMTLTSELKQDIIQRLTETTTVIQALGHAISIEQEMSIGSFTATTVPKQPARESDSSGQ